MTVQPGAPIVRGIACSFGCGNDANFVLVDITSSDTSFLCVPCFLHVSSNMAEAIINPHNPLVQQAIAESPLPEQADIKLPGQGLAHHTMPNGQTITTCADCGAPSGTPCEPGCIFENVS